MWAIRSKGFKDWLGHELYKLIGKGGNSQAVQDAVCTIEAQAKFDHEERRVFRRVAYAGNRIYIDLCDSSWKVIEVDANGWRVLDKSPVMFTRSKSGTALLPEPAHKGSIETLRHLN